MVDEIVANLSRDLKQKHSLTVDTESSSYVDGTDKKQYHLCFNTHNSSLDEKAAKELVKRHNISLVYFDNEEGIAGEYSKDVHFHFELSDEVLFDQRFTGDQEQNKQQEESLTRLDAIFNIKSRRIAAEFLRWYDEDMAMED